MVAGFVRWFKSVLEQPQSALIEKLLVILKEGNEVQIRASIYGCERLSSKELQIPRNLLKKFHAPNVEKYSSGCFILLIVQVPWSSNQAQESNELEPILVAKQSGMLRVISRCAANFCCH